jgi:predicted outer membrane repeat protein
MSNEGDLRYCIGLANASKDTSNTITFAGGLNGTIQLTGALSTITNGVTIDAGSDDITILGKASASNAYSIFNVSQGVTAEIDNLWIDGGFNDVGGGIQNYGTLTLQNDVIDDNTATKNGGGIYNSGSGSLSLDNDIVQFNNATTGGGIYNLGSIRDGSDYDPTHIVANTVTGDGGGIYNLGSLILDGGETISGNTANMASGHGGGVYNGGLTGVTFEMSGGYIYNNDAFQGGGLFNNGKATLGSSTNFQGNEANQGGGLYLTSTSTTTFNTVPVSGNKLTGAGAVGQGVYYIKGAALNGLTSLTDTDDLGGQPVQGT